MKGMAVLFGLLTLCNTGEARAVAESQELRVKVSGMS